MNTKKLLLGIFILLFYSCRNDENICKITFSLDNINEPTYLFLADMESKQLVDSILVENGKLKYSFKLSHPKEFLLHNKRNLYEFRDSKFLWLEPAEIKIIGDYNFLKNLKVIGSNSHDEFQEYSKMLDSLNNQMTIYKQEFLIQNNGQKNNLLKSKTDSLEPEISRKIFIFLISKPNSRVTLNTLHKECYVGHRHLNKDKIVQIFKNLNNSLQTSELGIEIQKYIDLPKIPQIGEMAIDFIQLSLENDSIKLSDFRGKYVLVEFWASNCAPCRGNTNKLRLVYNKYKSLGFEILGVSCDWDKEYWVKTIKDEAITWPNVSDLKGWHNEVFLIYDIKFIPTNILIDPSGRIINKDICSIVKLEEILKKLLDDKNGL